MKKRKIYFALNWRTIVCFVFMNMLFSLYVYPKMEGTPYSVLYNMWLEHEKDSAEFTLLTVIPGETLSEISPLLKKALKVKSDITCDSTASAGAALTKFLKEKYAKKSNEKNDFYAIQYSTSSSDFENYLKKYPDSKYAEEARARYECFKENELWVEAKKENSREAYESFASYCERHLPCNYEGCVSICNKNHAHAISITQWYAITNHSKGNNPEIYREYANYIEQYGIHSPFQGEAIDSMNLNKDRFDWKVAQEGDSSDAYRTYLDTHEKGKYVWQANERLKELEMWEKTLVSGKYNDYCEYYSEYPDGRFADKAIEEIKQHENYAWEDAKKKNTLKSYEDFRIQFPSGYYASEAQNKITELKLAPYLKEPPSFNSITTVGHYSHPGYSLLCLGNVDKSTTITVSLNGPTGYSKQIKPGNYEWVRVKNGSYKILVQGSDVENWWGNAVFENRLYAAAWSTFNTINGIRMGSNKDEKASDNMVNAVNNKAREEEIKTLHYIFEKK